MRLYHKFISSSGIERDFRRAEMVVFLGLVPHLAIPLLEADDPNATCCILQELPRIFSRSNHEIKQKIIIASLKSLNNPKSEEQVDGRIPLVGNIDHDNLDERLKFRRKIADTLIKILSDCDKAILDEISLIVKQIYENPSSIASMRAIIYLCSNVPFNPSFKVDCFSYGLRSENDGILKETGLAIECCAAQIYNIWRQRDTELLIESLSHKSWIARKPLAKGLLLLLSSGYTLHYNFVHILLLRLCERHELYDRLKALTRHPIKDTTTENLFQAAKELDSMTRKYLYYSIHQMLPLLKDGDDLEEFALLVGELLEEGTFDTSNYESVIGLDNIEVRITDLCEDYLIRIFDETFELLEFQENG